MELTYPVMRVIRAHDGLLASLIVGAALASLGSTAEAGSNRILKGSSGPAGSVTGIDFNRFVADGKLYGVSTVDSKIFVLDAATGDTVYVAGPAGLVIGPDDLAVGSDGYVYYTDTLGGFVGRLDPATDATVRLASLPLVNSIRSDRRHAPVRRSVLPPAPVHQRALRDRFPAPRRGTAADH